MKTFQQFQEDISKLPGLGGGGGGTNSITDTAPGRSLKKRVKDVGKILTRPFHKVKKDPTEKFATEGVDALAEKLSDKEYKEVDALLNRDTLLRGNLIKNPTQRQKFATMKARDTFRRIKKNEDGKLRIDRGTENKIKVNTHTVSKNFPELSKKPVEKYKKYYRLPYIPEGVAALALKGGSKLIPALMTGIGAAGTIMQIKNPKRSVYTGTRKSQKKERIPTKSSDKTNEVAKDLGLDLTDPRQRRKAQSRAIARGLKKKNKTNKKINTKTDDVVKSRYTAKDKTIRFEPKEGEVKKSQEMLDKLNNPNYFDKIMRNIRKEEAMAAPTNNVGGGQIAGTVESGDNPPVKKKKRYIYGGTGSRKMWMNNK